MSAELVAPGRQDHLRPVPNHEPADAAFDAVYREHFDRLRRFVLGMTGNDSLAEDIAQETLLRAYVRMEKFDFDRPLWPWLKTVATRLVFDHSRAQKRESLEAEPVGETASDTFDVTVERPLLAKALRCLPARQRVAVGLRYLEDWKAAEVADALGLSRVAAEQLLLRARRRLSAEYLAQGGEPVSALRVALWPVLVFFTGLRDRIARFRQFMGTSTAAQLPMSLDGATQMVAAAAFGGVLLASGVALAATAPRAVEPTAVRHASVFHADDVRAAVRTPAEAAAAAPARAQVQPLKAASPAGSAGSALGTAAQETTTSQPATKVTRLGVETQAPVDQAPAGSGTQVTKERSAEKYLLKGRVEGRAGGNVIAETAPALEANCTTSQVVGAACAALDTVDEAVPSESN